MLSKIQSASSMGIYCRALHPSCTTVAAERASSVVASRPEGEGVSQIRVGGKEKRPREERERMVIRRHGLAMALGLWLMVAVGARGGSTDSRHSGTKPAGAVRSLSLEVAWRSNRIRGWNPPVLGNLGVRRVGRRDVPWPGLMSPRTHRR